VLLQPTLVWLCLPCVFAFALSAGSNLTTNLRDFFSRATSRKASKKEEQDLKGFGGGGCVDTGSACWDLLH
jgi:hypothetical protein